LFHPADKGHEIEHG